MAFDVKQKNPEDLQCAYCRDYKNPNEYEVRKNGQLMKTCYSCRDTKAKASRRRKKKDKITPVYTQFGNDARFGEMLHFSWDEIIERYYPGHNMEMGPWQE